MGKYLSSPPSGDDWERVRSRRSDAAWNLSIAIGRFAALAVLLVVAIYSLGQQEYVRAKLAPLLPKAVLNFFIPLPQGRETGFGLGDTKERVVQAQGKPTAAGDNVWSYGESKVFFHAGRVVGWRTDPGNPLRVR